jgi:hypothetical protein
VGKGGKGRMGRKGSIVALSSRGCIDAACHRRRLTGAAPLPLAGASPFPSYGTSSPTSPPRPPPPLPSSMLPAAQTYRIEPKERQPRRRGRGAEARFPHSRRALLFPSPFPLAGQLFFLAVSSIAPF